MIRLLKHLRHLLGVERCTYYGLVLSNGKNVLVSYRAESKSDILREVSLAAAINVVCLHSVSL